MSRTAPVKSAAPGPASTLARLAGRGAVVNLLFGVGIQALTGIQGLLVPRLLGPGDIGLFSLAMGGVTIGLTLKELGIPEKLVQERDVDLYTSYAVAFTLELLLAATFFLLCLAVGPILAALYHRPQLTLLVAVLSFTIFTTAFLELPAAIPYREMRFVRRNLLTSVGPVASFVVTVPSAFLGFGVWSLVAGALAGFGAAATTVAVVGPLRPRLLFDRALAKRYLAFGWPLWISGLLDLASGWGAVFVVSSILGIAGLGLFELAQSLAAQALQVDGMLSDAIFPALCAMQGAKDRMRSAFVKTNRLSMLWAAPVGFGLLVFAHPLIHQILGARWAHAQLLVQAEGAGVVVTSIGFNWRVFYSASGNNRPQLVVTTISFLWLGGIVLPLLWFFGLRGAAASIAFLAVGSYVVRQVFLRRLLGRISLVRIVWREVAGAGAAAGVLFALRSSVWKTSGIVGLLAQGLVYLALCAVAAVVSTGPLLRDALRSLRSRAAAPNEDVATDHQETGSGLATGGAPWLSPLAGRHLAIPSFRPPATEPAVPQLRVVSLHGLPRAMAFPLGVSADPAIDGVWVTSRDWPALGRYQAETWSWTPLSSFPHAATPDGAGGCWTALTRSNALAHVDAAGDVRLVTLPRTRELLVTALAQGALWVVDGHQRRLLRIDDVHGEVDIVDLPDAFRRPDFIVADRSGQLWVGDTNSEALAVVRLDGTIERLIAPHRTRAMVADPMGRGMWLGSSSEPAVSLVGEGGEVMARIECSAIPFGLTASEEGWLLATLPSVDGVALLAPSMDAEMDVLPLPAASRPLGCALHLDRLYVALAHAGQVAEIAVQPTRVAVPS